VLRRDLEAAIAEALRILTSIDERYGRVDLIEGIGLSSERRLQQVATRFAAAFGQLVCDPATPLTPLAYEQLIAHHRWTEILFSASGFGSADHLAAPLSTVGPTGRRVPGQNLPRFMTIFSAAAGMTMNLEETMSATPAQAAAAFLAYLASRFCFTDAAHALRERLLEWLPDRLPTVKLGAVPLQHLASPYMHCSYALTPRKHAIKTQLIAQMRRACLEAGCPELDADAPASLEGRPAIVVTTENFSTGHSIWRTHSRAVRALRSRFNVTGLLAPSHRSPDVDACFDEVIAYGGTGGFLGIVKAVAGEILARRPVLVLHLGVGMSPYVIALASLRLAPVQAASFGHTATTCSPQIDAMILPDDFVGDPACFTETLVRTPREAMPYRRRDDVDYARLRERGEARRRTGGPVRIAIPASVMKLGPPFFDALGAAAARAAQRPLFEVFPLGASGLGHAELKLRLEKRLPGAVVNEELPYETYIEQLAACDFYVCPFPYGNMNSIVDAALVGLPGVCLDGPEAHAHADVAYFRRMGLPEALACRDLGGYVAAIRKLVDDPAWLAHCRAIAAAADLDRAFFGGDESLFVDAVERLIVDKLGKAGEATPRKAP